MSSLPIDMQMAIACKVMESVYCAQFAPYTFEISTLVDATDHHYVHLPTGFPYLVGRLASLHIDDIQQLVFNQYKHTIAMFEEQYVAWELLTKQLGKGGCIDE